MECRPVASGRARSDADLARRQRRLERQRQEAAAQRRRERRRRVRRAVLAAAALALVVGVVYLLVRPDPEMDGVERTNGGGEHVGGATYDEPAPTSGDHRASAPACGVVSTPLELDLAIHALEHGAVVVWYQPEIEDTQRGRAEEVLGEWDSHWILSPNPGISTPFVATAWNRRLPLDAPGERLREFVDTYRRRGPERVDCPA